MTFWSVLTHCEKFSWGLSKYERLLYVLRYSMKFWRFSEVFSLVLSGSEIFLNVIRHYQMFLCVLKRVLRHSGMFCMRSLGLRRSLTSWVFWGFLRHFNEF